MASNSHASAYILSQKFISQKGLKWRLSFKSKMSFYKIK